MLYGCSVGCTRECREGGRRPSRCSSDGQLVLCFEAKYLGCWRSLCLVRWLDVPKAVVQTCAKVEKRSVSAAESAYLAEMLAAPFAAYRWSPATGSRERVWRESKVWVG